MDLKLSQKLFIVTGATSGFGRAIAETLLEENAHIIINARGEEKLKIFQAKCPSRIEYVAGDITTDATISNLLRTIGNREISGVIINAGGPPAKSFVNTILDDWDAAYKQILRWKIKLTHALLERFEEQSHGKIVFIESASVKQPIENLVLSNSLRLAVVGFVKTLSQEVAGKGINVNIIAPGYHATPAMERLFEHKSNLLGISPTEARTTFENQTKTGKLGDPNDLASLAVWLMSDKAAYVTGQTIVVDGGLVLNAL